MKLCVYDCGPEEFQHILVRVPDGVTMISPAGMGIRPCTGCFSCWIKTPGTCAVRDDCRWNGPLLSASTDLILVSRMCYGGYSPPVKCWLDRSTAYLLPFFTIREGEMHHPTRCRAPRLRVHSFLYGDASSGEKQVFEGVAKANAINFNAASHTVSFVESPASLTADLLFENTEEKGDACHAM